MSNIDEQAAALAEYMGEQTVKVKALGSGLLANGINVAARTADFLLSAFSVDRDGEVLVPEGCDFKHFEANPIVLFNHNRERPIGHIKEWSPGKFLDIRPGDGVYGRLYFDETADAEDVWKMVQSGTIRASSPGFKPLNISREKALPGQTGVTVTAWELIEWSPVPVPCNPDAVRKAEAGGVRSKTLRELFPDAYAALDREQHDRARYEGDCERLKSAAIGVGNYLRSQTKDLIEPREKAYTLEVAVRDSALPEALAACGQLGRVLGARFLPDEWLEQMIQEDVDGNGDEFANEDGTPRMMPGLGAGGASESDGDGCTCCPGCEGGSACDCGPHCAGCAEGACTCGADKSAAKHLHKVHGRPRGQQTDKQAQSASAGSLTSDALGAVLGTLSQAVEAVKAIPAARDAAITEHLTRERRARIGN